MKKSSLALSLLMSLSPLAAFAATAPLDLVGPVSDYKIYVTEEIGELVTQTQAFTDAVKKATWPPPRSCTRQPAFTMSPSNRSPSCSATSTPPSTPVWTTTRKA